jgi:hypothetical protein
MDEVVVSATSFLVIRLLGQEQERRCKKLPQKRRWWMVGKSTVEVISWRTLEWKIYISSHFAVCPHPILKLK